MRGKKENQNSKIRLLTLRRLEYQRKEKAYHRIEFKDVHKWADEQEQEEAVRKDYINTYEFNPCENIEGDSDSSDDLGSIPRKKTTSKKVQYQFSAKEGTRVRDKKKKKVESLVSQMGIEPY